MKMRERVGLNLQNLRRARGLSQEALALLANVDRTYVGKIENAKYSVSVDVLEQLSEALDIDTVELFRPR
jgi:transcriptional regulator with XRE-family HTH domain